eukprot:CAMPEP_0205802732 /NCGR_PEP_ID=MMETSP0205-20121125/5172_1 /ASSEMBLY_ACC=CAM_ASM_000278 /TAXON_ID=36767 /ORGANISM="Euplotes focardii, Strain TN1" /LENGTH=60 /DNA_ID=CAMNT_0053069677 /DNA_START=35 /DNA_END=217 /DNA_ORIENTATION=-
MTHRDNAIMKTANGIRGMNLPPNIGINFNSVQSGKNIPIEEKDEDTPRRNEDDKNTEISY